MPGPGTTGAITSNGPQQAKDPDCSRRDSVLSFSARQPVFRISVPTGRSGRIRPSRSAQNPRSESLPVPATGTVAANRPDTPALQFTVSQGAKGITSSATADGRAPGRRGKAQGSPGRRRALGRIRGRAFNLDPMPSRCRCGFPSRSTRTQRMRASSFTEQQFRINKQQARRRAGSRPCSRWPAQSLAAAAVVRIRRSLGPYGTAAYASYRLTDVRDEKTSRTFAGPSTGTSRSGPELRSGGQG